jgi:hypothetical protein
MAVANLGVEDVQAVYTDKDSIVIKKHFDGYEGGRSLDVTGFTPNVISAGHVVIRETATGNFKPMPVTGDPANAYGALPAGHTYAGIVRASQLTKTPMVGVMTQGTVNPNATPYPMATILAAVKTALPLIEFRAD